jgi:hypothetical protein
VRFCDTCAQQVFYCATIEEAQAHAGLGDCVAIDAAVRRGPDDLVEDRIVMGTMVGRR